MESYTKSCKSNKPADSYQGYSLPFAENLETFVPPFSVGICTHITLILLYINVCILILLASYMLHFVEILWCEINVHGC